jgi:hypothetical protein
MGHFFRKRKSMETQQDGSDWIELCFLTYLYDILSVTHANANVQAKINDKN